MSKGTRLFVVVTSTMLAAGVATAAVASYGGFGSIRFLQAGAQDDLQYIPGTAQFLAYADVSRLVDSDLRQRLHPDLTASHGGRLAEEIGLDLAQDVDSVLVAAWSPAPGAPQPDTPQAAMALASRGTLLLARGRFDVGRIEATVRNNGGAPDHKDGIRVVTNAHVAVAFLDTGFIAVGQPEILQLALDTKAGRAPGVRQHETMMRLMGQVDTGTTWMVADLESLQAQGAMPVPMLGQLPPIAWVAASGVVGEGLEATLLAEGRDDRAAEDLREVVRGLLALARLQSGDRADAASWLDSVQLTSNGNTVGLSFALPAAFFERLQKPAVAAPPPTSGRVVPGAFRRHTAARQAA